MKSGAEKEPREEKEPQEEEEPHEETNPHRKPWGREGRKTSVFPSYVAMKLHGCMLSSLS